VSRPERRPGGPDDTRLIQRRRSRNVVALLGGVILVALAGALFVLPVRSWLNQRAELSESRKELTALEAANDRLQEQNDLLQTNDGIARAARTDLGMQQADEAVRSVLPPPAVPAVLPAGWPYSLVTQILTVRTVDAMRAAQAPATAAPGSPADTAAGASADPAPADTAPPTSAP